MIAATRFRKEKFDNTDIVEQKNEKSVPPQEMPDRYVISVSDEITFVGIVFAVKTTYVSPFSHHVGVKGNQ